MKESVDEENISFIIDKNSSSSKMCVKVRAKVDLLTVSPL